MTNLPKAGHITPHRSGRVAEIAFRTFIFQAIHLDFQKSHIVPAWKFDRKYPRGRTTKWGFILPRPVPKDLGKRFG